jgi:magnesium transporter
MTSPTSPVPQDRRVQVVLSAAASNSLRSVWKSAALPLAELGIAACFIAGIAHTGIGESSPWFVALACLLGLLARAVDLEGWALLVPGGATGRAERAFGPRIARLTAAAALAERLLAAALASVLVGHYALSTGAVRLVEWSTKTRLTAQELVAVSAIALIGLVWTQLRFNLGRAPRAETRVIRAGILVLVALTGWGVASVVFKTGLSGALTLMYRQGIGAGAHALPFRAWRWLVGLALVLPVIGGGESIARAAHEFAPPRLRALRRTSLIVALFGFVVTLPSAFLFVAVVPEGETGLWLSAPLAGIAQYLAMNPVLRSVLAVAVALAVLAILLPAAHAALEDSGQLIRRLATRGVRTAAEARTLGWFGSAAGAVNIPAAAAILITVASGAQVTWLCRAYGTAVAAALLLKIGTLVRLRAADREPGAFRTPPTLRIAGREMPIGLVVLGVPVAFAWLSLLGSGDVPSIVALLMIVGLYAGLAIAWKDPVVPEVEDDEGTELPPGAVSVGNIDVRPGNVLVAVSRPDSLAHVVGALATAGDRDVVVVTIRLLGGAADYEATGDSASTRHERYLFSQVLALTERHGRPVRLLILPARNIADALIDAALQLKSSEVFVGESATLSADEQARLLGDAWERADAPKTQQVHLVIFRQHGRTETYFLGAHPPSLTPNDLDLIHRVWLDAVKAVGPHVHHHDVVRAALTQMENQLSGSQRDDALAVIRNVARPADELAAAVHARNYTRLRDLVRNRHAGDLAAVLTDLGVEDQVIVFRILPRKTAAAVFEYLSRESQESLLKAMAQEDVASLLNNMAPDDRTMFLEELPAAATRKLLALLTPAERAVALTLLGYPENSVGRLMTPNYVRVREHWTVREVLDHIRAHGQDSETLSIVYVIDEQGLLIDDIRIREFLLSPLESHVADLMDRRFVSFKATDDQKAAIAAFRQYDRTALAVTDTAGMLIGIVTIDDVLDVVEETTTGEIQRIGGLEALDEPYMRIAFGRMIRKRAGWLTALFLGEMLTATAMGVFEAEIARAVVLALFVPLIISSGGNSGSQAATLVIRALALGEVGLGDWWRIIRREVLAGLALGAILGSIGFFRISIWSAFSDIYGPHWLLVALTVALALNGIVLWGTLIGSILPLFLRRLGFDPATSSAPFVATLVDVTGLVIYFSVAMVILRGTLL